MALAPIARFTVAALVPADGTCLEGRKFVGDTCLPCPGDQAMAQPGAGRRVSPVEGAMLHPERRETYPDRPCVVGPLRERMQRERLGATWKGSRANCGRRKSRRERWGYRRRHGERERILSHEKRRRGGLSGDTNIQRTSRRRLSSRRRVGGVLVHELLEHSLHLMHLRRVRRRGNLGLRRRCG
jgi:hypothetical protein